MENDTKTLGAFILARRLEAAARFRDRRLRTTDALGDRRLGHQEGGGDLRGRQAADRPQSERQLRRRRQRRMAAQEQQRQRVVLVDDLSARWRLLSDGGLLAQRPRCLGPKGVDQSPAGDRDQPAARIRRHALNRPLLRGRDQRLLRRVLSEVEATVAPGDRRPRPGGRAPAGAARSRRSPGRLRHRPSRDHLQRFPFDLDATRHRF